MMQADLAGNDRASQSAPLVDRASGRALELSRRLDWRFLLPEPTLRSVGYFGDSSKLLTALEMFGQSVTAFSGDNSGPVCPRFDTVVLRYPSLQIVEAAGRMTKPEGHMYIEVPGTLSRIRNRTVMTQGLAGILKYARTLWKLQFDDIHAYWHRPGFEGCREIIPLFDSVAMRFVLSRERPTNLAREFGLIAARCLLRTGLLPHLVPCYSVIAHKRKAQEPAVEHRN